MEIILRGQCSGLVVLKGILPYGQNDKLRLGGNDFYRANLVNLVGLRFAIDG
jgi:hypothetical protein